MLERLRRIVGARPVVAPVLAIVLLVAFGGVLVGLHVRDYTRVSPSDELQHLDYLNRVVRENEMVRRGDLFHDEALRTQACQGLDAEFTDPPCGLDDYDPRTFQEGGFNTAYINPPIYYGLSGYTASALSAVTGSDSLFTTGRLTGILWLGAALVLLWLAMAELAISWQVRVPILLLTMTAPTVLEAVATINPDSTALFAGASVLLAILRWERTGRWWWPALAAVLALMLKSTNIIAVGLGILYLAIRHAQTRRPVADGEPPDPASDEPRAGWRPFLRVTLSMAGGVAVVAFVWLVIGSAIARVPSGDIPMQARFHVDSIGAAEFLTNSVTGFTPLNTPYVPVELATAWISPVAVLVDRLFLVGLGVAAFAAGAGSRLRAMALATLMALALVGPGFVVVNFFLTDGMYVEIPRRYGLSAVPGMAIALAVVLRDRRALAVVSGGAGLIAVATLRAVAG